MIILGFLIGVFVGAGAVILADRISDIEETAGIELGQDDD